MLYVRPAWPVQLPTGDGQKWSADKSVTMVHLLRRIQSWGMKDGRHWQVHELKRCWMLGMGKGTPNFVSQSLHRQFRATRGCVWFTFEKTDKETLAQREEWRKDIRPGEKKQRTVIVVALYNRWETKHGDKITIEKRDPIASVIKIEPSRR